ncbi:MAG TPA: VOC family protein [Jatrophihabitans sp.]|jgi:predicted lactoylglutathione lyase|nr:VOC family protein [Jatrophihabitans sp.]
MSVPAVISLVTLGVADVERATRFYQALGFERSGASVDGEVSFFRASGGSLLAVWDVEELRKDAAAQPMPDPDAFRGTALAMNVESATAVEDVLARAVAAGARIARPAETTEWGGYNGYFADPEGHLWEVAHNPFWPIGPDGMPQLPE